MFAGEPINVTERRAVLHTALRAPAGRGRRASTAHNVVTDVHEVLGRMADVRRPRRSGAWTGPPASDPHRRQHRHRRQRPRPGDGLPGARAPSASRGLTCRFVSNVDGADIAGNLADLDPATTLFVVSSKTFTTIETLTNASRRGAGSSPRWATTPSPTTSSRVSTNAAEVAAFGIDTANMFGFWDWVGGRYSVDSAIGLSLMIAIGPDAFREFLDGFHTIDGHFRTAPARAPTPRCSWPMLGVWYANVLGAETKAVLPYAHELRRFPAYLQQLDMECNGKRVRLDGSPVTTSTPGRSCGASRAPTASTRSTNCCTRAPGWCRSTSSASPSRTTPVATSTTC